MKKIRGKRRYFRYEQWFAYSHRHLDFWGYGKTSTKLRRQHIIGHLALLDRVLEQLEHFHKPFQAWVNLNDTYPEYGAVYIHSENPYDAFPYQSEDLQLTAELPVAYCDLVDLTRYDVSYSDVDGQVNYVVQVKGKGLSVTVV